MEQSDPHLRRSQLPGEPNPALREHASKRAQSVENRVADRITAFAGSMPFVYLHVLWFAGWIALGVEKYPFGLLTMIVSLEAIFLSTFVLISQNRTDARRQVLAAQEWQTVQDEDSQNQELLDTFEADPRADEGRARLRGGRRETRARARPIDP